MIRQLNTNAVRACKSITQNTVLSLAREQGSNFIPILKDVLQFVEL